MKRSCPQGARVQEAPEMFEYIHGEFWRVKYGETANI